MICAASFKIACRTKFDLFPTTFPNLSFNTASRILYSRGLNRTYRGGTSNRFLLSSTPFFCSWAMRPAPSHLLTVEEGDELGDPLQVVYHSLFRLVSPRNLHRTSFDHGYTEVYSLLKHGEGGGSSRRGSNLAHRNRIWLGLRGLRFLGRRLGANHLLGFFRWLRRLLGLECSLKLLVVN